MEVNKKQLAEIFGASIRTIQNWQERKETTGAENRPFGLCRFLSLFLSVE
ncbi:terminase small subunit [Streptococcus suis]